MDTAILVNLFYIASSILFIVGLKMLGSPDTARRGNLLSSSGMLLAVLITLLDQNIIDYRYNQKKANKLDLLIIDYFINYKGVSLNLILSITTFSIHIISDTRFIRKTRIRISIAITSTNWIPNCWTNPDTINKSCIYTIIVFYHRNIRAVIVFLT